MANYIIVGEFGSGKTEIALHLALKMAASGEKAVCLVDLDIVNPYFRSREAGDKLKRYNISVISNSLGYEADLPALSPAVSGVIEQDFPVVFDVGGNETGARVLGRFQAQFLQKGYHMWMVVNPYRPESKDIEKILALAGNIEKKSRLRITGLIANPNLGSETEREQWKKGREIVLLAAAQMKVPLIYSAAGPVLYRQIQEKYYPEKILHLELMMRPPWEMEN